MLVNREKVDETLGSIRGGISQEEKSDLYNKLERKYKIPAAMAGIFFNQMRSFDEAPDFLCYCFLDILAPETIEKYFTNTEIKKYSKQKFGSEKIEFPYVFKNMIQINEDQWIGHITLQELMRFRAASLINYNEETQRPMKTVFNGNEVTFKITLNQKSVKGIADSMLKGTYIPDDITLNVPEEFNVEYEDGELVVTELDHFDILDGYHRWVAMSKINNTHPLFDYNLELRITHFSTEKAQYYIYQKEQKNQMRKSDIRLYNQHDPGLIVCKKINQNANFDLKNRIGKEKGMIQIADFAEIIDRFYFDNKTAEMPAIIKVSKEIIDKFNAVIESNEKYLTAAYDYKMLYAITYVFSKEDDYGRLLDTVEAALNAVDTLNTLNKRKLDSVLDSVCGIHEGVKKNV